MKKDQQKDVPKWQENKKEQKAMDFLPKDQKDLNQASYWKKFFEFDRFKEGFEWYASFEDLSYYLKQVIKDGQKVCVPGCGNSDLSYKILKKLGPKELTIDSFDYEENVIAKMNENKPKDAENLTYRYGDCTNLSKEYKDEQFNVAVDKGTLDAIAVDVTDEIIKTCNAYFNEMMRVLDNKNGTLCIVSLLQPHVLKIIFDFFLRKNKENKY